MFCQQRAKVKQRGSGNQWLETAVGKAEILFMGKLVRCELGFKGILVVQFLAVIAGGFAVAIR